MGAADGSDREGREREKQGKYENRAHEPEGGRMAGPTATHDFAGCHALPIPRHAPAGAPGTRAGRHATARTLDHVTLLAAGVTVRRPARHGFSVDRSSRRWPVPIQEHEAESAGWRTRRHQTVVERFGDDVRE